MKNKHIGDTLDDFLKEEGILEEVADTAVKRVLAFQIQKMMKKTISQRLQWQNR
jgi:antitoxin HicB